MLGVGISALPSDLALFNVDAATGQNRRMTLESLDIMLRLWTEGPIKYDGEFWSVRPPETAFDFLVACTCSRSRSRIRRSASPACRPARRR